MKKQQRYTPEFRAEAVKLVTDQGLSQQAAADRLAIPKGTLANWVAASKASNRPAAPGARSAAELEKENARLRKELAEARMERDILKNGVLCQGVAARYAFMKQWRLHFPVKTMSRLFGVSRSGFYSWLKRKPSRRAKEDERLKVAIKAAHKRTRETYSARRLPPELAADGFIAGRDRISRLRRELGLRCRQKRKFKATTNSKHNLPVAENLLNQTFMHSAPNRVWVADITYIPTGEGWLYLAGIKDIFTCEIVGYAMAERMTQDLTSRALFRAVQQKTDRRLG